MGLLLDKIAVIHTDFKEKFGIPRQSGLVDTLSGYIILEKKYRNPDAVRGLEEFSHIWLLWEFQDVEGKREGFRPMVRPPKLGGNKRVGVFATRSPFRPNPIGLSCVKLEKIEYTKELGPVIYVSGIDMRDDTPIYDIKPYLPYADAHPDAEAGFTAQIDKEPLEVVFEASALLDLPENFSDEIKGNLIKVLSLDPRSGYKNDPAEEFGMSFAGFNVRFSADGSIVRVKAVTEID